MSFLYVLVGTVGTIVVARAFGTGPFRMARLLFGYESWSDTWGPAAALSMARSVIGLLTTAALLIGIRPLYNIVLDSIVTWTATAAVALLTAIATVATFRYWILQGPLPALEKRRFQTLVVRVACCAGAIVLPLAFGQITPLLVGREVGGVLGAIVLSIAVVYWFCFMGAALFLGSRSAYGADQIDGRLAPYSSVLTATIMLVVAVVRGPAENVPWVLFFMIATMGFLSTAGLAVWELSRIDTTAPASE